jgi:hypothetical protein
MKRTTTKRLAFLRFVSTGLDANRRYSRVPEGFAKRRRPRAVAYQLQAEQLDFAIPIRVPIFRCKTSQFCYEKTSQAPFCWRGSLRSQRKTCYRQCSVQALQNRTITEPSTCAYSILAHPTAAGTSLIALCDQSTCDVGQRVDGGRGDLAAECLSKTIP